MTNYVIYNTSTGIVSQSGTALEIPDNVVIPGFAFLQTDIEYDYKTSRVVDGTIVTIPERPSPMHEWVNDAWVDQTPIAQLKKVTIIQVNRERERRNYLPINYSGNLFDADLEAQRNISAWMTNIAAGQNPPVGFVWRDYNNVDHAADAAFIIGLGNAVTLRGTQLYQTSWAKKAEIDALTTAEQVNNYDVNTGW
jgi:hypothetical protein